ncbi:PREDICTED: CMT1A duplicated region transcript 4 protein homolog, partial [Mesitornis unicolor]|uniref:CMT1A duplicated region transcript 4 protein homolog n=1 Tax=Mesitornis unicolor TaxID=54374 RepID=UPI000528B6C4
HALPLANLGLPRHLIQHHRASPAYVTYVSPMVRMLVEQDQRRRDASTCPAKAESNGESQEDGSEEETQVLSELSGSSSTILTGRSLADCPTGPLQEALAAFGNALHCLQLSEMQRDDALKDFTV